MRNISIGMLLGSIFAGIIYAIFGEILYNALVGLLPRPILIMLYFGGLCIFLTLIIGLIGKLIYAETTGSASLVKILITTLILLVAAALFEFLYDIEINRKIKPETSYIFILDDSGSMEQNDPDWKRVDAIFETLEDQDADFPYAVYSFANECYRVRDMAPSTGDGEAESLRQPALGGTYILDALQHVWNDIQSGEVDPGSNGKVLLLSDGLAMDVDIFTQSTLRNLLKEYADAGIAVSTVGLGDVDDNLMQFIADKTGGSFVLVDDVDGLGEAMQEAMVQHSERNLINYRTYGDLNILYAILRVLFIIILGVIIGFNKTHISERFLNVLPVLISSAVGSFLAGICVEVGMNVFAFKPIFMRMAMCVLMAFTLLEKDDRTKYGGGRLEEGF